jgi:membrane protein
MSRQQTRHRDTPAPGEERTQDGPPESPTNLGSKSWWAVLRGTVKEFREDNLSDWAAALTYYAVLALFPGLLVLVSLVGLAGPATVNTLTENVTQLAPAQARQIITDAVTNLQAGQSTAGVLAIIGLATALWSASGYIAAFMRASNAVYDMEEGRPVWKTAPVRLGVTLLMTVLMAVAGAAVVLTGSLADRVGNLLGFGQTFVTVWDIAKWPVLLLVVSFMIAVLYWACPNVKHHGFRWVTPGGLLAVVVWVIASAGFAFYVANFGSYNKTYGTIAGVIVFLVWLWISNMAVLLGAEFDAELERRRAVSEGHPPDVEPYLEPRDTRKFPEGQPHPQGT